MRLKSWVFRDALQHSRGLWHIPRPYGGKELTMAKKAGRELIRLVSTAGTGYFYTTTKNTKRTPDKPGFKKYDPKMRKHGGFKGAKI